MVTIREFILPESGPVLFHFYSKVTAMTRQLSFRRAALLSLSLLLIALASFTPVQSVASAAANPIQVVIDADTGVDDAAAIAYLLSLPTSQVSILGITAVAGNTSVENAANNNLILLDTAQRTDIPVVVGAAQPLVLPASHQGAFIHGPDGIWFASFNFPFHDLSVLSHDAPAFLRDQAVAHPGATLLALGPLTNIAQGVQLYPSEMALYSRIVWMGGAKVVTTDGNTPVSVFNPWFDPDAAAVVLSSGIPVTMVTADAARTVTITEREIDKLARKGTALGQLLAPILQAYSAATNQSTEQSSTTEHFNAASNNRGGRRPNQVTIPLYDPAAAVLMLKPELGTAQSALVFVQTPDGVARGQTIIGLTIPDRIQMLSTDAELSAIADAVFSDPFFDLNGALFAILSRQPDNAQVILEVKASKISEAWLKVLTR
jgi:inosine-uridine nucleoside N-ribohydrolase